MVALLSIIVGAALTIAAILAAGNLLAPATPLPAAVRFTTGAALLSAIVFLLLACHAGYWPVFIAIPVVLTVFARRAAQTVKLPRMPLFFLTVFALSAGAYVIYALAPEIQADAAGYHLRLVSDYVRAHGFTARTGFYDVLPQGMEMLFVPAFAIGVASAAKLVHFAFLLLTIPLIRELAREAGLTNFNACAAAAIFFLAPVCATDGTSAYTEAALVCACSSTLYLLVRWHRNPTPALLACAALNAAFCYAIKPTFGWVTLCALVFVTLRNRKSAALFAAMTIACITPWLIRAWILGGSPAAPFLTHWLPNRILTPDLEQHLAAQYSAFRPTFSGTQTWLSYTLSGNNQGVFGPAFLLIPIAFFSLKKRPWLVLSAALLAVPFLLNTGARFLMPAMALAGIAIASVLPRPAALALVIVQAIAAYTRPGDWSLGPLPLNAALRFEPEDHYLRRSIKGFAAAAMLEQNTPANAKILACTALPEAYIPRQLLTWWHSRQAQQFADALHFAMMSQGTRARLISWRWRENQYQSLRLTALSDLRVVSASLPVNSWTMHKPGESITLPTPPGASGADLLIWPGDQARERTEVLYPSGAWSEPEGEVARTAQYIDLRRDATAYIRRAGYHYIAIPVIDDPFAEIGIDMVRHPNDWGVTIAGQAEGLYLLRID